MTTATKFATEWKPILGEKHNYIHGAELEREFDKFVTIPADRLHSGDDNTMLMKEITHEEVIQAITALIRHKAAGPDGLNNDFFKDAQAILVPSIAAISN